MKSSPVTATQSRNGPDAGAGDFMNEIVTGHGDREIHVILDNLNTHKPRNGRWLKSHKNVHFPFIPTYSSWLNQIECWFSILSRKGAAGSKLYVAGSGSQ